MIRYAKLRDSIDGAVSEAPAPTLPPEIELQALWFAGAFGRTFIDNAGSTVKIVQFGEWNRVAGPDFLHASVEVDGEVRAGAVEIDTHAHDWEAHGHGADPGFNDVVLHVVFRAPEATVFTRTSEHRAVPQVTIPPDLLEEVLQWPVREVAIARPGRCVHPLADMPENSVAALLREAAEFRAGLKSTRFLRTADAHGRDAALFQATAESLGYRPNALAMRLLAQRLPLTTLREDPEAAPALLFGSAGFLAADLHEKAPTDTRDQLRRLWDTWWKHRARWDSRHPLPWKLAGQRPANHPHRRVAALAALVRSWPAYRRHALGRPFSPKALLRFLADLMDPFWTHRHTLSSAPSAKPVALVGRSRAIELLINHLAPLALQEDPRFDWDAFLQLPATAANDKVKRCAIRLFGSENAAGPWLKKAAHHQALLQIYHDFCLEDLTDCEDCPFPEQLGQWR